MKTQQLNLTPSPTPTPYLARYRDDEGTRCVLVVCETKRYLTFVSIESRGVKVGRAPVSEARHMSNMPDHAPKKAARTMLRAGRDLSITKGARDALRAVINQQETS